MISEKRAFERFDFFVVLEFKPFSEQAGSFLGITRNFSSDGFSFESQDFDLELGGTLECRFKQPDSDLMVSVPGEIVWKESDLMVSVPGEIVWKESFNKLRCLTGIKFREIGVDVKNKILNIMSLAGEVPADFFPGVKEAVSYGADQAPEGLARESEDVPLKEPVHHDIRKRVRRNKYSVHKKKIPLLIPLTALVAGVALFIAFNESDRSLKSLVPPFIKQLYHQKADIRQPVPVVEDYQLKAQADRELSEPLELQTVQEEESLLTEKEKIPGQDLNVEIVPIPEISKKQPILFGEDLIASNAARQKSVQADRPQSVPGKDIDLAKEDLIDDILTKQKSIEEDQKTVIVKDTGTVKEEKLENIRRRLHEEKDINKGSDKKMQAAMVPDRLSEKPPAAISGEVEKELIPVSEGKDIKEGSDENIQEAMVPDGIAEKPPLAISGEVEKEEARKPPENLLEEAAIADSKAVVLSEPLDAEEMTVESVPEKELNDEKTAALPAVELSEKTKNELRNIALILKPGKGNQNASLSGPLEIKREEAVITETLTASLSGPRESKREEIVVLEETFDDNSGKWDIFNTSAASAHIRDGKYHIENKRKTGKHFVLHYHDFPSDSDFIIKTDIRKGSSIYYHAYGFALGAKDAFNNHVFLIIGNQYYLIDKNHNGAKQNLAGGKLTAGIINENSLNTLKIERNGSSMRFYINDNFIDEVLNISFDGNKIGFVVEGISKISIDNIHSQVTTFQ
jgi:hypothetical protein